MWPEAHILLDPQSASMGNMCPEVRDGDQEGRTCVQVGEDVPCANVVASFVATAVAN